MNGFEFDIPIEKKFRLASDELAAAGRFRRFQRFNDCLLSILTFGQDDEWRDRSTKVLSFLIMKVEAFLI